MDRIVRRVDAEQMKNCSLGVPWHGFLMPKEILPTPCLSCDQTGWNDATRQIEKRFYDHEGHGTRWAYEYGVAPDGSKAERGPWRILGTSLSWCSHIDQEEVNNLVKEGRLMEFTHTFNASERWKRREDGYIPSAHEINEANANRHIHDAINRSILVRFRAERAGVYGLCMYCKGEGESWNDLATKAAYDSWKETAPLEGTGWQLWETVSEGSPTTPAFESAEDLIEYLMAQGDCADQKARRGGWARAKAVQLVAEMSNKP